MKQPERERERERERLGGGGRNREIHRGDCLDVLGDLDKFPNDFVDLIYLDPPFNSNAVYNLPFNRTEQKDYEAVAAFEDTWSWGPRENELYDRFGQSRKDFHSRIFRIVDMTLDLRGRDGKNNIAAYLLNIGERLLVMKRILKPTGSIWLHCDPRSSHYLKMLMDAIFGHDNYRNEIVWHYTGGGRSKSYFPRKHDILLWYSKSRKQGSYTFNIDDVRMPYEETSGYAKSGIKTKEGRRYRPHPQGKAPDDVWYIPIINPMSSERLGYPTQKPLKLLDRIIQVSSNKNDLVLDPFCGCGTTLHAAEKLGRRWIGVDISRFSASLVKDRLLAHTDEFSVALAPDDITVFGLPTTVQEARNLVTELGHGIGRLEFEKWVCGVLGTSNMLLRKKPGAAGADGGVDGLLKFAPIRTEAATQEQIKVNAAYAVIQVKSGKVTPDAVKALTQVIDETPGAIAAVMVAFNDQRSTFDNNASEETIPNTLGGYRKVQFLSIDQLLDLRSNPDFLPNVIKMGGKVEPVKLPKTEPPGTDETRQTLI